MKQTTQALAGGQVRAASPVADFIQLTKPRISLMVTLTGAVGFFMASTRVLDGWALLNTMIGVFLVSGAANTLNQVLERTPDARMRRTARRPLPTGRVKPEAAIGFATLLGVGGTLWCGLFLNWITAALAAATMLSYAFVYTPLKRKTVWNTLIGAVPGALPPLGGWAAATGRITWEGFVLFLIVFLWQVPHFLSIAWLLRQEYAKAGFRMLPVVDARGERTGRHMNVTALLLVPCALVPTLLGVTGWLYFAGAAVLSLAYAAVSYRTSQDLTTRRTRGLFLASLIYLPALLVLMMLDKLPG